MDINFMLNGKVIIILLTIGLITMIKLYKMIFFQICSLIKKIKVELKNATGVDTLQFSKKDNLAILKSEVNKLDIDKLKNVPGILNSLISKVDRLYVDKLKPVPYVLKNLSELIDKDVFKKTVYKKML